MEIYPFTFKAMTTPCQLQLACANRSLAERLARRIEEETRRFEKKFNFYQAHSWLNRKINQRTGSVIQLDEETAVVLREVRALSQACQGLFDITIGTLKQAYRHTDTRERELAIAAAQQAVGLHNWWLEGRALHCPNPLTRFDLGGVIKEYAVDRAASLAREHASASLINFGGDLRVNGRKPDGEPFRIGIRHPQDKQQNIAVVALEEQALTTSANYERTLKVGDEEQAHIIGSRLDGEILSATVISDSALKSGIFSTALMINPTLPLPASLKVVLIDRQLRLHQNLITRP